MANILITFASMSGNTEEMADLLKADIEKHGHEVTFEELDELSAHDLVQYDGLLLGSYTWNDGDLPYEAEDIYEEIEDLDLTGIKVAVFGSGDTNYPLFCEAVHTFEKQLTSSGATLVQDGLKIEMAPTSDEDFEKISAFGDTFATFFNTVTYNSLGRRTKAQATV